MLNMLDDKINANLEMLYEGLATLELRCRLCKKPHDFNKEKKLRWSTKTWINEIKRLKEEAKNNNWKLLNHLLDRENKFSKLLTDLEYEEHNALHNVVVLEWKLIKLEISLYELIELKIRFHYVSLWYYKRKVILKKIF